MSTDTLERPVLPRLDDDQYAAEPVRVLVLRMEIPAHWPDIRPMLMRVLRIIAPMAAEGVPAEAVIRKITPREYGQTYGDDGPPRGTSLQ